MLPIAKAKDVAATLARLAIDARNVRGSSAHALDKIKAYLSWVPQSTRMLQYVLPVGEIDRLVSTSRYWAVLGMESRAAAWELVDNELEMRVNELENESRDLSNELSNWAAGEAQVAVLDTMILMHQFDELTGFGWNDMLHVRWARPIVLVLPMMVIDELDNIKDRGSADQKTLARKALARIEEWFPDPKEARSLLSQQSIDSPKTSRVEMRLQFDDLRHSRLENADAEIVSRAASLLPFASGVSVVTNDTNMLMRARGAGLAATRPVLVK